MGDVEHNFSTIWIACSIEKEGKFLYRARWVAGFEWRSRAESVGVACWAFGRLGRALIQATSYSLAGMMLPAPLICLLTGRTGPGTQFGSGLAHSECSLCKPVGHTDEEAERLQIANRQHFQLLKEKYRNGRPLHFRPLRPQSKFFRDWGHALVLGRKIAEGGQAEIYEATLQWTYGNEKCVLKVFKSEYSLTDLERQWSLTPGNTDSVGGPEVVPFHNTRRRESLQSMLGKLCFMRHGVQGTGFWRAPDVLHALKKGDWNSESRTKKVDVYRYAMTCCEVLTDCLPIGHLANSDYDAVIRGERPLLMIQYKICLAGVGTRSRV